VTGAPILCPDCGAESVPAQTWQGREVPNVRECPKCRKRWSLSGKLEKAGVRL